MANQSLNVRHHVNALPKSVKLIRLVGSPHMRCNGENQRIAQQDSNITSHACVQACRRAGMQACRRAGARDPYLLDGHAASLVDGHDGTALRHLPCQRMNARIASP